MKKVLFIFIALISFSGFSQTPYQKGMTKAFDLWQNNQPWEAVNIFERIAKAEPDNWLPPFYIAQINVIQSFNEKDKTKMTAQLNKARDFINDAMILSENNPEIMVVEAQYYTAWIVMDGQQYGMKYSAKVAELYQKAAAIAPENPRVAFGKVEWDMGTARFFGQPMAPFCEDLRKAYLLFEGFESKGEFHPRGGDQYAKSVIDRTCTN